MESTIDDVLFIASSITVTGSLLLLLNVKYGALLLMS